MGDKRYGFRAAPEIIVNGHDGDKVSLSEQPDYYRETIIATVEITPLGRVVAIPGGGGALRLSQAMGYADTVLVCVGSTRETVVLELSPQCEWVVLDV